MRLPSAKFWVCSVAMVAQNGTPFTGSASMLSTRRLIMVFTCGSGPGGKTAGNWAGTAVWPVALPSSVATMRARILSFQRIKFLQKKIYCTMRIPRAIPSGPTRTSASTAPFVTDDAGAKLANPGGSSTRIISIVCGQLSASQNIRPRNPAGSSFSAATAGVALGFCCTIVRARFARGLAITAADLVSVFDAVNGTAGCETAAACDTLGTVDCTLLRVAKTQVRITRAANATPLFHDKIQGIILGRD